MTNRKIFEIINCFKIKKKNYVEKVYFKKLFDILESLLNTM